MPNPSEDLVMKAMIAGLMELILFEMLSGETASVNQNSSGPLVGIADPVAARALSSMFPGVAHEWMFSELARLGGVSRFILQAAFVRLWERPIKYLQNWRMTLAEDELRQGTDSIGEIAMAIGFRSSSAFSTAFALAFGCSPKRFIARL